MSVAIVTGASRGLGEAVSTGLASTGWSLVIDGRDAGALAATEARLALIMAGDTLGAVPGDITDPAHRRDLVEAAATLGGLDLLINNAGTLGASPLPSLADYPLDELRAAFEVNVVAPLGRDPGRPPPPAGLAPTTPAQRHLRRRGRGRTKAGVATAPAKAALEHLGAVLAVERPVRSPCGRSTPATSARRCTRRRSRARTSPTDPNQPPSCPPFSRSS
jgi:NAD(P)-dependent dehydrogenase (short-subunit alcohol dehydrogenase family)